MATRNISYEMGRCGEKRFRSLRRRFKLEKTSIRQRWLEGWVFDGMVLAAVYPKKKKKKI